MKITNEELSKMAGEDNIRQAPNVNYPILTMQGRKNYFRLRDFTTKEKEESKLGNSVSGVFLKVRRCYSFFKKDKFGTESKFSTEGNSDSDILTLFEVFYQKDGARSTEKIDEGTGKELKLRHPELKFNNIIYFLMNDKVVDEVVVKLQIKGSSLSNLFDYFKTFGNDEHIFEYETILGTEKLVDNQELDYFPITFKRGDKLTEERLEIVSQYIKKIYDELKRFDEWKAARQGIVEKTQVPEAYQTPDEYDEGEKYVSNEQQI